MSAALAGGGPISVQRGKSKKKQHKAPPKKTESGRGEEKAGEPAKGKGGKPVAEKQEDPADVLYQAAVSYLRQEEQDELDDPKLRELFLAQLQITSGEPDLVVPGKGAEESEDSYGEAYYDEIVHDSYKTAVFGPGFDEKGGAKSDWASKTTTAQHEKLRIGSPWGTRTSFHHKVSRSNLAKLHERASADPASGPFFDFLREVADGNSGANTHKLLHNLPANLEMGPLGEDRGDDPGSGFDGNCDSGGLTPRSAALAEVDSEIGAQKVDWRKVATLLRKATDRHGGQGLAAPDADKWRKDGAKWRKRGQEEDAK